MRPMGGKDSGPPPAYDAPPPPAYEDTVRLAPPDAGFERRQTAGWRIIAGALLLFAMIATAIFLFY
jgi:hypothetical protein